MNNKIIENVLLLRVKRDVMLFVFIFIGISVARANIDAASVNIDAANVTNADINAAAANVANENINIVNDTNATRNGFANGWMKSVQYNKSFWSENMPTFFRIDFAHLSNHGEYDVTKSGKKMRTYIFANIGANIPIWSGNTGKNRYGNYSLAAACPIIAEVWLDMISYSSPLVNTSYRIGAPTFTFLHSFINRAGTFLKNYSILFAPFRHESTHIGDELTIFRMENDLPIRRINVSYNCTELVLTLNAPTTDREENHAFRFGFFAVHNFEGQESYYEAFDNNSNPDYGDIITADSISERIKSARGDYEFYFQYQYQSKPMKHFQFIASAEIRNRALYNYPMQEFNGNEWYLTDASRVRRWCFNAFAGVRYTSLRDTYFSRFGIGLSAYYGINPYGQFRNYDHFQQYGLSIIFE
jgi:hypothetical protein